MTGTPVFSIHFDHEAETFDTPQRPGQPAATTGDPSSALADWKGERSRRVPGDGEPNGVRRTSEDDRRESSGTSTGWSEATEERSEPRGHDESARPSSPPGHSTGRRSWPPAGRPAVVY